MGPKTQTYEKKVLNAKIAQSVRLSGLREAHGPTGTAQQQSHDTEIGIGHVGFLSTTAAAAATTTTTSCMHKYNRYQLTFYWVRDGALAENGPNVPQFGLLITLPINAAVPN